MFQGRGEGPWDAPGSSRQTEADSTSVDDDAGSAGVIPLNELNSKSIARKTGQQSQHRARAGVNGGSIYE